MGFGRSRRFDGLAGAEAPAPARLRAARPEVARRRSRRLGGLRTRQISPDRLLEGREWAGDRGAGTEKASVVAPESFVCRSQSLLPSRATGVVQPPGASKSSANSVARPDEGSGGPATDIPAGIDV
jgi:hypothetical protein